MPKFNTSVTHTLDREEAIRRLQSFSQRILESYQGQISDVQENWGDDGILEFSFVALGLSIEGKAVVEIGHVHVNGSLPFAAVMFRGQIEQQINSQLVAALTDI